MKAPQSALALINQVRQEMDLLTEQMQKQAITGSFDITSRMKRIDQLLAASVSHLQELPEVNVQELISNADAAVSDALNNNDWSIYCVMVDIVSTDKKIPEADRLIDRKKVYWAGASDVAATESCGIAIGMKGFDRSAYTDVVAKPDLLKQSFHYKDTLIIMDKSDITLIKGLCDSVTVTDVFTEITGIAADYLEDDNSYYVSGTGGTVDHNGMKHILLTSLIGKSQAETSIALEKIETSLSIQSASLNR